VLVDAPQLFESGFDAECGFILSVLAPYEVRLARIMARDGLDEARAKARLAASHDDGFFTRRSDAVILNGGDIPALEDDVRRLLTQWGVAYEN
jgi:dephospho-CoA kinase